MASKRRVNVATVQLWSKDVGAVAWDSERQIATFEYDPAFINSGLEVGPLTVPLRTGLFSFPELNRDTYLGLPGFLADALPDKFGNRIINAWLARQGRSEGDFTPVERLCYMGVRAMGALEFKPTLGPRASKAIPLEVAELTQLVKDIFSHRTQWVVNLEGKRATALNIIIRVGTSAGGNRPKAVIAWNPKTQEVRSGQADLPQGFEHWILKFDGSADKALGDPKGFGRVEYAYHKMAKQVGIPMTRCHLLEEGGRAHFMTKRFDRDENGGKIHVQSLCAMAHYDYNAKGAYSYEQALSVIQRLNLGYPAITDMYRRMVFNVVARNQDDHTRNIAFMMDRDGKWSLSPAFDIVWAYNPADDKWTRSHQMTVNGKRDDFERSDLLAVAESYGIKGPGDIIEQVIESIAAWPSVAKDCGVDSAMVKEIAKTHRLNLRA